ncbi:Riboflavin biosynthesis protein RibD, partial [Candidatus Hodgkinia cicadicola]
MAVVHSISILKYLIGGTLKQFVYNENNSPVVTCYAIVGQWIIKTETPQGGQPHAETLCLSELAREKPIEVVLSLSPCIEFGKTPPCCYNLLASCSNLTVLELDRTQSEFVMFLRCFISVGWTQPRSTALIPSIGFKADINREQCLLGSKTSLITCSVYPVISLAKIAMNAVTVRPNTDILVKVRLFARKLQMDMWTGNIPSKPSNKAPLNSPLWRRTDRVRRNLDYYKTFSRRLRRLTFGLPLTNDLSFADQISSNAYLFMTRITPPTPISRR